MGRLWSGVRASASLQMFCKGVISRTYLKWKVMDSAGYDSYVGKYLQGKSKLDLYSA